MEYCSLGSCRDIMNMRNRPFTEEQIAVIIRDALHGLSYLHGQKKIHRDIKADNILMNDLGECKLGNTYYKQDQYQYHQTTKNTNSNLLHSIFSFLCFP